nr:retrovirus-related Pol polyprotein from transposon TNT 1-94 [Tanacetum cinerariifolium]
LKSRIPYLQKAFVGFYEPCVLGKQKKVSFVNFGNTRKLQRIELLHTDVYGLISVASIGRSCYYVTFIDDSSRKVWVYFLKNKSEVFNTFKKWKAIVENETNLQVKCLKSDNGGEYSSREFIESCTKNEIRMLKQSRDYVASFHATYCKEELERFKLHFGKVRLANDKTLDIEGVGDVVLKTSFGRVPHWLRRQAVEGYKGSLMVAHGNKCRSLYMVKVPFDGINAFIDGRGNTALWHQRCGYISEKDMKILALKSRIPYLQKAFVAVSGSTRSTKLKFDNIYDLILGEDICRNTSGEYSKSLLSAEDKVRGRSRT